MKQLKNFISIYKGTSLKQMDRLYILWKINQMKTTIITFILAFIVSVGMAQNIPDSNNSLLGLTPQKHVYYDTVKTVKKRVEYSPDTIPVWFKEVVIKHQKEDGLFGTAEEVLRPGFIVWQTYHKYEGLTTYYGNGSFGSLNQPEFYKTDYVDSSINGKFLYIDKKPVTNKVIYAIKR